MQTRSLPLAVRRLVLVAVVVLAATAEAGVTEDAFVAGYAAAVLEREFRLTAPSLRVDGGVLRVAAGDLAGVDRERVVAALQAVRGVSRVEVLERGPEPVAAEPAPQPSSPATTDLVVLTDRHTGVLPGGTLFQPLVADPRWPHFAASYQRYLDDRQLRDVTAVSFGETFTLFRDRVADTWWEIGIQAGVFALFDLNAPSMDLVNADYLVGVPLGLRRDPWSALLRLYHQSSHLGDEFLLRTKPERLNLSYEAVDLKLSFDVNEFIRLYAGGGFLFDQEPSGLDPWSVQYGLELTSPWPARGAGWRPLAAVDVQHREENDWSSDLSIRAGVQIDGVLVSRNMQLLLEYFRGRSPNGQFYKTKIDYLGLGVHFHF